MNFNITNEHGEPTNFGCLMCILLLIIFYIVWAVGESGWDGLLKFIFE